MVILFAIKEENDKQEHDETCASLVQLIGQNCHGIAVDRTLSGKYHGRLSDLFSQPRYQTQAALFLSNIICTPGKFVVEPSEPPDIPPALKNRIPHEDHYIVRAAMISAPVIVTDERKLRDAINNAYDVLGLNAITPADALELAKDQ